MADWTKAAEARGIELNETQKERLDAMEKSVTLLAAMIDWKEDPCQVFRVQEDPQLRSPKPRRRSARARPRRRN